MAEKSKHFVAPKQIKSTRPSTVTVASSSRSKTSKTNILNSSRALNNTTIVDGDTSVLKLEGALPVLNAESNRLAYGKYLRAILEECLVDEKIEREETQMDIQMAQLADRFQKTVEQLDKTNRRLKDISFVVEQKRLLNLKNNSCSEFYEMTDKSDALDILKDLAAAEQKCLDTLTTKNIDFGYDKDSGHKQLLDAVNDAISGLENIKKHSNLDTNKFKAFEETQRSLDGVAKDRLDLESLRADFEARFPKINEKLLREASEKIAKMFDEDLEEADDE